jgi:hypothetical protein
MAEVLLNRLDDGGRVVYEDALEGGESLLALFEARVRVTKVRLPLKLEHALRLVLDDLDPAELSGLSHNGAVVARAECSRQPDRASRDSI